MQNNKNIVANILSAVSFLLTAGQTNEIMQVVMLILSIISVIVSISFTLYKWYKEAKKDNKITKEEIKEGLSIIGDGVNEIIKEVDNYDKNRGNSKKDQ